MYLEDVVEPVALRVARGAWFLDLLHGPIWANLIDLESLDMDLGDWCVLGQLYNSQHSDLNGYITFVDEVRHDYPKYRGLSRTAHFGFLCDEDGGLNRCWKEEIMKRRYGWRLGDEQKKAS